MDTPEATARLVSRDGSESVDLPDELFRVLRFVAQNLAEGRAVSVAPLERLMTTQEAAEFLGMSRPSLVKIVDRGDIACTKVGRHRRIRLGDLIDYRTKRAEARRAALDEMARVALENDIYEKTARSGVGIR